MMIMLCSKHHPHLARRADSWPQAGQTPTMHITLQLLESFCQRFNHQESAFRPLVHSLDKYSELGWAWVHRDD